MNLKSKSLTMLFLIGLICFLAIHTDVWGNMTVLTASGSVEHHAVFKSGDEGHHTYRIPSMIRAKDGTLIAFAEGRRDNRKDPGNGHINLVYKLSHDGGRTWSSLHILEKPKEGGCFKSDGGSGQQEWQDYYYLSFMGTGKINAAAREHPTIEWRCVQR